MPRKATLSVMGIYNYYDSLFDGFRIPANMEIEDQDVKQDIIDTICIESAGLEVLYPEPEVFKFAIEKWTNLNFKIWDELQATRLYEYNPIWNKDGTVTETETRDLSGSKTGTSLKNLQAATSGSESTTGGGTRDQELDSETDTQTEGTADKTTTNSVKVFNHGKTVYPKLVFKPSEIIIEKLFENRNVVFGKYIYGALVCSDLFRNQGKRRFGHCQKECKVIMPEVFVETVDGCKIQKLMDQVQYFPDAVLPVSLSRIMPPYDIGKPVKYTVLSDVAVNYQF